MGNWVKVMLLLVLLILVLNLTENVMWGGVILCRFFLFGLNADRWIWAFF